MKKVIVIGAGASGMMAAIEAAEQNHVVLLETNASCGKKILATGNGRCNYWNASLDISSYQTDNEESLSKILSLNEIVLKELESFGLKPKIKDGYYYPLSNTANSVKTLFEYQLEKRPISIKYNAKVTQVEKKENTFFVTLEDGSIIKGDSVILATGSKASPKTGSTGLGYSILSYLGHTIQEVTPSLTYLLASTSTSLWAGVRTPAKLELFIDDHFNASSEGELQLTEMGISGICVFNLSGIVAQNLKENKRVAIRINFLPFLESSFEDFMENRIMLMPDTPISILLESVLHYKLLKVIFKKSKIGEDDFYQTLTPKQKENLKKALTEYEMEIIGTGDFEHAQVCRGGLSLQEINPQTMESKIVDGLYVVGELLNVDGICGGYNLAFAFISGYLAGKSCGK